MWISLLTEPFFETCRRTHACEKGKFVAGDLHAEKVGASGSGREEGEEKEKKEERRGKKKRLAATATPSRNFDP